MQSHRWSANGDLLAKSKGSWAKCMTRSCSMRAPAGEPTRAQQTEASSIAGSTHAGAEERRNTARRGAAGVGRQATSVRLRDGERLLTFTHVELPRHVGQTSREPLTVRLPAAALAVRPTKDDCTASARATATLLWLRTCAALTCHRDAKEYWLSAAWPRPCPRAGSLH